MQIRLIQEELEGKIEHYTYGVVLGSRTTTTIATVTTGVLIDSILICEPMAEHAAAREVATNTVRPKSGILGL